jgi:RNA polymerase sigma-70 factor (ECF subfamily)
LVIRTKVGAEKISQTKKNGGPLTDPAQWLVKGFGDDTVRTDFKSDIELVSEVKGGNRKSFSELVSRHQRALLRVSLRFTKEQASAEDIVQESFIKAYQKIHLFEGRSSFKSWLFQIALNTARNRYRERSNRSDGRFDTLNIDDLPLGVDPGAETSLLRADVRRRVRMEVDRLPERQRMALTLRIFEDMSFKEIAQIMDCPYDTAKANYRHALLKLKERIEEAEGFDEAYGDLAIMTETMNTFSEVEV